MNSKQAIALAVGVVAALTLVIMPRGHTPLQKTSVQQVDGGIVTTYKSHASPVQPVLFAVVLLVTGICVYSLRRRA